MLYQGNSVRLSDVEWVIFDEVHYINDEQRGVVWEELLIMLPREIKLVLLSATFPNCLDFANWVGSTRQQVIHVLATLKRPVPLEHFVYTATNRGQLDNSCFLISNQHTKFSKRGIYEAIESLKKESPQNVTNVKVYRSRLIPPEKNNGIKCLMEFLKKNDKLPVIVFVFSKDACFEFARAATRINYTTKTERSQIVEFFNSSINRLAEENLTLPQIQTLKYCLERGIAVHHSGVLPILREIVEILFQKSLIKVLFATETFSIGVNMPAKTVVFSSLTKPSDTGRRDLYPSEYIQMAGRAGRRGQDESGTVIIVSSKENEIEAIENIMNGESFIVKSKFCLTYGMILRMLSKKSGEILKVEDLMRSSYSEFGGEAKEDATNSLIEKITELENECGLINRELDDCEKCKGNILPFFHWYNDFQTCQKNALEMLLCTPTTVKQVLDAGRLCLVMVSATTFSLALVSEEFQSFKFLASNQRNSQPRSIPVLLYIADAAKLKSFTFTKTMTGPIALSKSHLFFHFNTIVKGHHPRLIYVKIHFSNILMVTSTKVKVKWKNILQSKAIMDNKEVAHKKCTVIMETLSSLSEFAENIAQVGVADVLKPMDLTKYSNNFEDFYTITHYMDMLQQVMDPVQHQSSPYSAGLKCSKLGHHYKCAVKVNDIKCEIEKAQFKLSDESLQLLPEYNSRLKILEALGFIDNSNNVLMKGRLSIKFKNNFDVMLTEILLNKELLQLEPPLVAATLSCFVQEHIQRKQAPPPNFPPNLKKVWELVSKIDEHIAQVEKLHKLEFNRRFVYPDLIIPIFNWASGVSFADIVTKFNLPEGVIVRHVLRLDEICSEMELASLFAGNPEMNSLIKKTRECIHSDIIFTPSLYLA